MLPSIRNAARVQLITVHKDAVIYGVTPASNGSESRVGAGWRGHLAGRPVGEGGKWMQFGQPTVPLSLHEPVWHMARA